MRKVDFKRNIKNLGLNPIYVEGEWYIVKNYTQFVQAILKHQIHITHISFDHDLADDHYDISMYWGKDKYAEHLTKSKEKTGYDCAKFMKEYYDEMKLSYPVMFVHSMNPVGTENIINLFK
jgi:hypothetical protein